MAKEVVWTKRALKSYEKILDYLLSEWTFKTAEDFDKKVSRKLSILRLYPFSGLKSLKRPGYMKFVLSKHNSLYYRIKTRDLSY